VVVEGAFQLLSEHPERKTHKENKEAGKLRLDTVDTSKVNRTCGARSKKTVRFL
jgi:hypothetical protein